MANTFNGSRPPQLAEDAMTIAQNVGLFFTGDKINKDAQDVVPQFSKLNNFKADSNLWRGYSKAVEEAEGDADLIKRINRRQMTRMYHHDLQFRTCKPAFATFVKCIHRTGSVNPCAEEGGNMEVCLRRTQNRVFYGCGQEFKFLSNSMDETGKFDKAFMYGFEKCMVDRGGAHFFRWESEVQQ